VSGGLEQYSQPTARMEHASLDRIRGHPDNLGSFSDRSLMVVDQIENFSLDRRELRKAPAEELAAIPLLKADFRVVR
jgi:hypothetical protein